MFLDPDDWYELNACEVAYNQISKNGNDFVIFPHYAYLEELQEKKAFFNRIKSFLNVKTNSNINPYELKERFFINCFTVCQIYSKNFLNKYNIRYSKYRINEDIKFFVNVFLETENISIIDIPLYCYRKNSKSTSFKAERYDTVIQARKDAYEIVKNHKNCKKFMPQFLVYCTNTLVNNYFKKFTTINKNIQKDFYCKIRTFFKQINSEQDIEKIKELNRKSYKNFKYILSLNYDFWKIFDVLNNLFSIKNKITRR